jgi:UDP-N-acetylmuramate: L-alanyl-gamma-D-glutamyl-meso-diaminopimelate ligase
MNVHFIAIGGSAMHNLAIALARKGYQVTGSDDEIFEPSKSRLQRDGILPKQFGWDINNIHNNLDAVIVGMHAREDNPELLQAKSLNIPIFSYPEYLYEQSKDKKRIVIGGSHGKTTITSMVLNACKSLNLNVDYMVGAQLEGYDCMVKLTEENEIIILEGDEYLSSPIDRRPKFHLYKPHVALLSGIAWDHINVFPSFDNYISQFEQFISLIEKGGTLIYNTEDNVVDRISKEAKNEIGLIPYRKPNYSVDQCGAILDYKGQQFQLNIFGDHNLQNLMGAMKVCESIGIDNQSFLLSMKEFTGAGKRLEKVYENEVFTFFKDFAHSPSKLMATTYAVKNQFKERELVACMELHTFSSLNKEFLPLYKDAMSAADYALVYFNPEVVKHKKLPPITKNDIQNGFGGDLIICDSSNQVRNYLNKINWTNKVLLMMSSGNFDGIDYAELANEIADR